MRWPVAVVIVLAACVGVLLLSQTPVTVRYTSAAQAVKLGGTDTATMTVVSPLWRPVTPDQVSAINAPFDQGREMAYRVVSQTPEWGILAGRLMILVLAAAALIAVLSLVPRHAAAPASDPR